MSSGARTGRRRGQPLAVLGVVLAGWVGLRVVLWEPVLAVDLGMSEFASTGAPTASLATIAPPALTPAGKVPAYPTPLVLSLSKHRPLLSDRAPGLTKKTVLRPAQDERVLRVKPVLPSSSPYRANR